jgi:hypothetical protein
MNTSEWVLEFVSQKHICKQSGIRFLVTYHPGRVDEDTVGACSIQKSNCNIETCPVILAAQRERIERLIEKIDDVIECSVGWKSLVELKVEQLNCRVEKMINERRGN